MGRRPLRHLLLITHGGIIVIIGYGTAIGAVPGIAITGGAGVWKGIGGIAVGGCGCIIAAGDGAAPGKKLLTAGQALVIAGNALVIAGNTLVAIAGSTLAANGASLASRGHNPTGLPSPS
jgi:hypothetical protein